MVKGIIKLRNRPPIIIKDLPAVASAEVGSVYEWCKGREGQQVSIYTRKKGSTFANHYHTGSDPSKNPELFLLISGRVRVVWEDVDGNVGEEEVHPLQEIHIAPYVFHAFEAVEDCLFLEYRATEFDPQSADSFGKAEFKKLQKQ